MKQKAVVRLLVVGVIMGLLVGLSMNWPQISFGWHKIDGSLKAVSFIRPDSVTLTGPLNLYGNGPEMYVISKVQGEPQRINVLYSSPETDTSTAIEVSATTTLTNGLYLEPDGLVYMSSNWRSWSNIVLSPGNEAQLQEQDTVLSVRFEQENGVPIIWYSKNNGPKKRLVVLNEQGFGIPMPTSLDAHIDAKGNLILSYQYTTLLLSRK